MATLSNWALIRMAIFRIQTELPRRENVRPRYGVPSGGRQLPFRSSGEKPAHARSGSRRENSVFRHLCGRGPMARGSRMRRNCCRSFEAGGHGSGASFLRMSGGWGLRRIVAGLCSKNSSPNFRSRYGSAGQAANLETAVSESFLPARCLMVIAAVSNRLNPSIGRIRCLIRRTPTLPWTTQFMNSTDRSGDYCEV